MRDQLKLCLWQFQVIKSKFWCIFTGKNINLFKNLFFSEMTDGLHQLELNQHQVMQTMPSPDHLVNRKDLLERMGIHPGAPTSSQKTRSHSTNRYY